MRDIRREDPARNQARRLVTSLHVRRHCAAVFWPTARGSHKANPLMQMSHRASELRRLKFHCPALTYDGVAPAHSKVTYWPIATNFSLAPDVSFWGEAGMSRPARVAGSVETDPKPTFAPCAKAVLFAKHLFIANCDVEEFSRGRYGGARSKHLRTSSRCPCAGDRVGLALRQRAPAATGSPYQVRSGI